MGSRATTSACQVWAPAKLNLFLEVLGRRDDGYHELETLMTPIGWYDTLTLRDDPSGELHVRCHWASHVACPQNLRDVPLPEDGQNLVFRAVDRLRHWARQQGIDRPLGARIELIKRVPMAAGLAGGSSDASAALRAAAALWNLECDDATLAGLSARVGSDCPFFFAGGAAICRGRGEQVDRLTGMGPWHFVVTYPPAGLSTAEVFRHVRPADRAVSIEPLVAALRRGELAQAGRCLHNRLQSAAVELSPWVRRLHAEFARWDFCGSMMSGSGTSFFGLCASAGHARRLARRLSVRGVGQVVAVASVRGLAPRGAVLAA